MRKLHMAPAEVMHEPLALAAQGEYFGAQKSGNLASWISCFAPFIAFDMLAAHELPSTKNRSLSLPLMVPYRYVPLPGDVVSVCTFRSF